MTFRHDPTDLEALNATLRSWSEELPPIEVQQVVLARDALERMGEVLVAVGRGRRHVVLVQDATVMQRNGASLKPLVHEILEREGFELSVVELRGEQGGDVHSTEEQIDRVRAQITPESVVLTLGSGVVTDVGKHAVYRHDEQSREDGETTEPTPLVFFATALSVVAYSAPLAPVTGGGVKRTRPSRQPDAIVMDLPTLVAAPRELTLSGIGDLCAMFVSYGDWYLHCQFSDDQWEEACWRLGEDIRRLLPPNAAAMGRAEPEALGVLAKLILLAGFSVGLIQASAPLSGYEHVTGHLLDLQAEYGDRDVGLHGLQVGLATLPCALAFDALLQEFDPGSVDVQASSPDVDTARERLRATFDALDPSGEVSERCWEAYAEKLEAWRAARPRFERFLAEWEEERARLRELTAPAAEVAGVLADAGIPLRFEDLTVPIPRAEARWAFANAHRFRDRFSSVDLLFVTGFFDDALVDRIFARLDELAATAQR